MATIIVGHLLFFERRVLGEPFCSDRDGDDGVRGWGLIIVAVVQGDSLFRAREDCD